MSSLDWHLIPLHVQMRGGECEVQGVVRPNDGVRPEPNTVKIPGSAVAQLREQVEDTCAQGRKL